MTKSPLLAALLLGLVACSDSDNSFNPNPEVPPEPEPVLSAEIRRTEYGIPHIKADDWRSLGYGTGYAYAQDNFCIVMREVVFAQGRSAELIGEQNGGSARDDLLSRYLFGTKEEFRENLYSLLPETPADLNEGFALGMNRFLEETGVDNLPEGDRGCRGEDWVFAIDGVDVSMVQYRQALRGSSLQGTFSRAILATQAPSSGTSAASSEEIESSMRQLFTPPTDLTDPDRGSNALGLGRDITTTGTGILLGNPHQPWFGDGAWYQAHQTIPGEYDAAGALLHGLSYVGIGFNKDVAWTHTVSFANRYGLYELQLLPDNPLQYFYGDEIRDITSRDITVQSLQDDGSLAPVTHTFYESHYGPIIDLGGLSPALGGWPLPLTGTVLAFKEANFETGERAGTQWLEKAQASNLDEYIEAISRIGNPVFTEVAADRNGEAFYGDVSVVPFITQEQLDACLKPPLGTLLFELSSTVLSALDGSDPDCEWGVDPEAPEGTNIYGASGLPQLRTTDYVGNSNNSYWLSDANNPLEGFAPIMGPVGGEQLQQFLRTRIGHLMVEQRREGGDEISETPLFDFETVKEYMYLNRVYSAEVTLTDVLSICEDAAAAGVQDACEVLAGWDQKVNLDSRGVQVWKEFWNTIRGDLADPLQSVISSDEFWAVDYDPADPINTPVGIDLGIQANRDRVIDALQQAKDNLANAGVALDAPWGEVQFLERNNENVGIHGGDGNLGVYGAISSRLQEGGYRNPSSGNSYIQVVTWDESECPIADVILVPSQSTDPESPHFADQTKLYSDKGWVRFPFCEEDIEANQIGETIILEAF